MQLAWLFEAINTLEQLRKADEWESKEQDILHIKKRLFKKDNKLWKMTEYSTGILACSFCETEWITGSRSVSEQLNTYKNVKMAALASVLINTICYV